MIAARSNSVRETEVTGIPSNTSISSSGRADGARESGTRPGLPRPGHLRNHPGA